MVIRIAMYIEQGLYYKLANEDSVGPLLQF